MLNFSTVQKEFTSAFALDNAKLSRIINILSEGFSELQLPFNPIYIIFLNNDKKIEIASLDQLLKLDNTVKNPIKSLEIRAVEASEQGGLKCCISYSNRVKDNVYISVESTDANFALKLFAELEEQVERTFLNNVFYRIFPSNYELLFLISSIPILLSFFLFLNLPRSQSENLSTQMIGELLLQSEKAVTIEGKVDFLFNYFVQELTLKSQTNAEAFINLSDIFTAKAMFIIIPILIVVGCAFFAILYCYPRAVFDWGDFKERYAHLLRLRNTLWIVVILSMVLGVLTNLFVLGLSGLINLGL